MVKMNSQTKIIVFTAVALTAVDLSVRSWMMQRVAPVNTQAGVITAREIRLVDNNGNLRADMTTDENSEAGLIMYDRNGVNRLQLDTWDNIPSLILNRADGLRSTYYGMDTDGRLQFVDYSNSREMLFSPNNGNMVISNGNTSLTIR